MTTTLVDERTETMATPKRHDVPVKIDAGVMVKVRIAAAYKGQSIAEYLSEIADAAADRDIDERHAAMRAKPVEAAPKRRK